MIGVAVDPKTEAILDTIRNPHAALRRRHKEIFTQIKAQIPDREVHGLIDQLTDISYELGRLDGSQPSP